MKRQARLQRKIAKRARFHCETCESEIRAYQSLVMRHNAATNQLRTPSGLVINLKEAKSWQRNRKPGARSAKS